MKLIKALIIAMVAALAMLANARADELVVHTASVHSESTYSLEKKFNNTNIGMGYRFENGVVLGVYHSSFEKVTAYVAKEFMATKNLGLYVGVATGYKIPTGKSVTPIAGALFKYEIAKNVSLNVTGFPPFKGLAGVAHLAFAIKFK